MSEPIKVVAYIRVSIEKQVQETEGLEIQKDRIIKFCEKNNYELDKIFSDEGISGSKGIVERPALREMINYCKNPPIQYVIIDKVDRLSRDFSQQLFIEKELLISNVKVLFAAQEGLNILDEDDNDPVGKAIKNATRQLMGVFAELEKNMINARLSDGMKKKAQNGNKPSGIQPFGYEYSYDRKSTVINEARAIIVQDIFSMRSEGKTLKYIVDHLNKYRNSKKYRNAYTDKYENHTWQIETIRKMLKNDYYVGKVTHAGVKIEGNHKPIIDMDTWDKVCEVNILTSRPAKAIQKETDASYICEQS